jgi:hypothetical protein
MKGSGMKMLVGAFQQQRQPLKIIGIITVFISIISIPLIFQTRIALDFLINDTVVEANVPEYVGAISNIGIFLWIATATVCLFTAAIARQQQWASELYCFYLYAGFFFLFLGFDDEFLFHESLFPQATGLPEIVVFFVYILLILGFSVLFWRVILKTQFLPFVLALMFLGLGGSIDTLHEVIKELYVSVVSDSEESTTAPEVIPDVTFSDNLINRDASWQANAMDIAEDAPKFLTIISFLVYFSVTALQHLKSYSQLLATTQDGNLVST